MKNKERRNYVTSDILTVEISSLLLFIIVVEGVSKPGQK